MTVVGRTNEESAWDSLWRTTEDYSSCKRSQIRLMAAVGRHGPSGKPRRLSLVECNTGETGHHGWVSRGSGKFGDRLCDAPYQETGTQIALNCGDNGCVSVVSDVVEKHPHITGKTQGGRQARAGRRREGEGAGRRRRKHECNLNGHAIWLSKRVTGCRRMRRSARK